MTIPNFGSNQFNQLASCNNFLIIYRELTAKLNNNYIIIEDGNSLYACNFRDFSAYCAGVTSFIISYDLLVTIYDAMAAEGPIFKGLCLKN